MRQNSVIFKLHLYRVFNVICIFLLKRGQYRDTNLIFQKTAQAQSKTLPKQRPKNCTPNKLVKLVTFKMSEQLD